MFDTSVVEKMTPDYWRNSQLSVARFSGAAIINGVKYIVCPVTDYLVREDIYKKEFNKEKVMAAEKAKYDKMRIHYEESKQTELF